MILSRDLNVLTGRQIQMNNNIILYDLRFFKEPNSNNGIHYNIKYGLTDTQMIPISLYRVL